MKFRIVAISLIMVLSIMSGSLAFSAFSGTIKDNVSATADFVGIGDQISVCAFWANNTELYVNDYGFTGHSDCLFNELYPPLVVLGNKTSYTGSLNRDLNISNLGPGNAILFCITVYNPNNQECFISSLSFGSFSGTGLSFFNSTTCNNDEAWFSVVNNSVNSCYNPGGYYGIIWENGNHIYPDSSLAIGFFIFMSQRSGNEYQESSFDLPIIIDLSEQ